jgi:hypothetical protein
MTRTIERGKTLLEKVQRKIGDPQYRVYDEIDEAARWISMQTEFTWLRKSNIVGAALFDDTSEYALNMTTMRVLQNVWIGTATNTEADNDITGITLTGTDPVSILLVAHGFSTDDQVVFSSVGGTTELNGETYRATKTDADNFTLNGTDSSDFTAWTSSGTVASWDTTDTGWKFAEEAPSKLFDDIVDETSAETTTVNSTGTVTSSTSSITTTRSNVDWYYYLKGGTNPGFGKIVVTPTPSTTHKVKIDYITIVNDITGETVPDIPIAYKDPLIYLASAYILERSDEAHKIRLAKTYRERGEGYFLSLVLDSQRNRTKNIDRPLRPWQR